MESHHREWAQPKLMCRHKYLVDESMTIISELNVAFWIIGADAADLTASTLARQAEISVGGINGSA